MQQYGGKAGGKAGSTPQGNMNNAMLGSMQGLGQVLSGNASPSPFGGGPFGGQGASGMGGPIAQPGQPPQQGQGLPGLLSQLASGPNLGPNQFGNTITPQQAAAGMIPGGPGQGAIPGPGAPGYQGNAQPVAQNQTNQGLGTNQPYGGGKSGAPFGGQQQPVLSSFLSSLPRLQSGTTLMSPPGPQLPQNMGYQGQSGMAAQNNPNQGGYSGNPYNSTLLNPQAGQGGQQGQYQPNQFQPNTPGFNNLGQVDQAVARGQSVNWAGQQYSPQNLPPQVGPLMAGQTGIPTGPAGVPQGQQSHEYYGAGNTGVQKTAPIMQQSGANPSAF